MSFEKPLAVPYSWAWKCPNDLQFRIITCLQDLDNVGRKIRKHYFIHKFNVSNLFKVNLKSLINPFIYWLSQGRDDVHLLKDWTTTKAVHVFLTHIFPWRPISLFTALRRRSYSFPVHNRLRVPCNTIFILSFCQNEQDLLLTLRHEPLYIFPLSFLPASLLLRSRPDWLSRRYFCV